MIDIPYIVLWIVLIVVAVFVWRIVRKAWKKRRARRAAARGENVTESEQGMRKVKFRWPVMIKSGEQETEKQNSKEEQDK